jgi:hypothetical protein
MSPPHSALDKLAPNPDWISLPIFDRKDWTRVKFGEVAARPFPRPVHFPDKKTKTHMALREDGPNPTEGTRDRAASHGSRVEVRQFGSRTAGGPASPTGLGEMRASPVHFASGRNPWVSAESSR